MEKEPTDKVPSKSISHKNMHRFYVTTSVASKKGV
jgi:hypothetical protein